MKKYLPKRTEIIDVGEELALYLKERISGNELQIDSKAEGGYHLCVTDLNETFADMATKIFEKCISLSDIEEVKI